MMRLIDFRKQVHFFLELPLQFLEIVVIFGEDSRSSPMALVENETVRTGEEKTTNIAVQEMESPPLERLGVI